MSGPAQRVMQEWIEDTAANGDTTWPDWAARVEETRQEGARLIGAQPEEIGLMPSTTAGITIVADGFPWKPGDNVVTLADEFPSNQYPWIALADRGVETRRVPTDRGCVDWDKLSEAVDARTRIVTVSWVSFSSGWRNDIAAFSQLAHERGALLFVDAIQALGVFEMDVRRFGVDFLAADGHKWMLGPEGAGLFFVAKEHLDLLRTVGVGWNSVVHSRQFDRIELEVKPDASRYEGGTLNMPGLAGLGASLKLLAEYGPAALSARVIETTDEVCQRLTEIGASIMTRREPGHKSSIVIFEMPGRDPDELLQSCAQNHVALCCRNGRMRVSPHAYNNAEDIDRLIDALRA
ncbi:MAG: aminotransferase class V-fold PLP-dependent enzyme [Pirellulales bacterium]|nr:aminotransferase class V-fold PLP-dependent enzyme [Pirellulales bacterium]